MPNSIDTNAKALKLNLDDSAYGAFAEIGGGQEVSRWFFRVGGAAGTVAKTMSAYDMTVSDAIYGSGERYVSRERVKSMLAHEYDLLVERLRESRGEKTAFFAFADTVATRSFKGGNECHGWIGLRFQHQPGAAPSELLLHAALGDPTAERQQQSLGILGVNLIYGAYYQRDSFESMLRSLLDGLSLDNLEIDVIDCTGPAFASRKDQRAVAVEMLTQGLTKAIVFDENGRMEQPSTVFRKRPVLAYRSSLSRDNPELDRMLRESVELIKAEGIAADREPLRLLELALPRETPTTGLTTPELLARINRVFVPGHASMLSIFVESYLVSTYLHRFTAEPVRFVIGLDTLITVLCNTFYKGKLEGGLLEALGRLLGTNIKLYVFPMPANLLRDRLTLHNVEPEFWSAADKPVLGLEDVSLAPPVGHLLNYLKAAGWAKSAALAH